MNVLDLFSGIGGFSLGLERAGMRTVAFCEVDSFCRAVLAKHWPGVPCYEDVRTLTAGGLARDGISVDVICGGFPCQDISLAGAGAGLAGERSGLWRHYSRLIGEIRPHYVIVENVAALLSRGLGEVLGDLAALGYDSEWHCIRAARVGLPHSRDRIWIVAYPEDQRFRHAVDAEGGTDTAGPIMARIPASGGDALNPQRFAEEVRAAEFVRAGNGIPCRMDRVFALGNAVVPQIPEMIGRALLHDWKKAATARQEVKP